MCVKWTRILGYIWYAHSRSSSFSACMLIGHLLWEVPMRSDEKKKAVQEAKSISMRVGGMNRGKQDLCYSISHQNSMNKSPSNRL